MAVTAADLQVKFSTQGADKVTGDIGKVNKGIGGLVKNAAAVGVGVLGASTFGILARGFAGGVSGALDFGKQMANVNSIAQVSDAQLASLSDQVLRMATDRRISAAPATLAAGLYEINSSGFAGADAMNILEKAAIAGTAGLTSTDTAARAITASLNAYGLGADQAGRVSDVLFKTVDSGVITFDQLANNLGNVLPIANSLGVGIEEVGAAYAQMTLSGVSASQAETQIASLMRSALNPTDQLTQAVQSHGHASAAAAIESEGLAGFLDIVNEAAGGNQETMLDLLGTQEAMNAATILGKNNTDDYRKAIDEMNEASADGGATQKALEKQMKSASFQIDKAKQAAQIFVTRGIGLISPAIGAVARGFTSFLTKGAIPFVDIMAKALTGSFDFREMLVDLPEPLRRFAGGVGTVLEGVGDLAEFMLQGDWSRVASRLPGELRQILGGFEAIGEELLQGVSFVANIAIDAVVSIASWAAGVIVDVAPTILSFLGDVIVSIPSAVADVLDWAAGTIEDIAPKIEEWVRDVAVDLETVVANVIDWTVGTLADLAPVIKERIHPVTVSDVTPRVVLGTPEITYFGGFDIGRFTADAVLDRLSNIQIPEITAWKLVIGAPVAVGLAITFGPAWVVNKIVENLTGIDIPEFTDWSMTIALGTVGFIGGFLGEIENRIFQRLTGLELKDFKDWTLELGIDFVNLVSGFAESAKTAITSELVATNIKLDNFKDWVLEIGVDFVNLTETFAADAKTAILSELVGANIKLENFTDWVLEIGVPDDIILPDDVAGTVIDAIINEWEKRRPLTGGEGAFSPAEILGSVGADPAFRAGLTGRNFLPPEPLVLPAPDTSVFDAAISGALENARKITTEDFTATLKADPAPFVGVVAASLSAGQAFGGLTFEPTLDADIGPFGTKMQQAWTAGGLFASETFRATLDADTGPALGAINQAIGAASAFARTWTATLTVDTSGAIAAAQAAVQFISDLLPNSPAKRGPLARMPSFTYLGDALLAEAGRMNRVFTGALTPPDDVAFAGAGGASSSARAARAPMVNNYYFQRANFRHGYDWEQFVAEKQRQADMEMGR